MERDLVMECSSPKCLCLRDLQAWIFSRLLAAGIQLQLPMGFEC